MKRNTALAGAFALLAAGGLLAADTNKFAQLHGIDPAHDAPSAVPASAALHAFATFGSQADAGGRGDIDFWLRTAEDLNRSKMAMGDGLVRLAQGIGDPLAARMVESTGRQLARSSIGGRGNVDYWMAQASSVAAETRRAARQLRDLASGIDAGQQMPLRIALRALAVTTRGVSNGGRGDVDYWMQATKVIGKHGQAMGSALRSLEHGVDGTAQVLIGSLGRQLRGLDYGGHGNVDYWMARCTGVSRQIQDVAQVMMDTANSL